MVVHQAPGPPTDEDLRIFFSLQADQATEHTRCSTTAGPCAHRRAALDLADAVLDQWLTRHPANRGARRAAAPARQVSANVSDETV